ncbi:hypothetical protein ACFL6Y_01935 [Elusimicrobiota bacterium]
MMNDEIKLKNFITPTQPPPSRGRRNMREGEGRIRGVLRRGKYFEEFRIVI